jgi:hypothetical protein
MNSKHKGIVFSLIITFLLISPISFAQMEQVRGMWAQIAGWWLMLVVAGSVALFIGAIILRMGHTTSGRFIYIIGLIVIFLALFAVEAKFFEILTIKKIVTYTECTGLFPIVPSTAKPTDPVLNVFGQVACVLAGYMPSEDYLSYATFFIFAVIIPMALLIAISIWSLDFVHPTNIRNVIAFCIAMIGFRAFFVTLFIEFLTFGSAGILALIVNMLLIMMLWRVMVKFLGFAGLITQEKNIAYLASLDRLMEEQKDILRSLELTPGDEALRTRLDDVRGRMDDLKKDAAKAGVREGPS